MKFAPLLLSFLFAALTVSAQVNPQCPMISVDGPSGTPAPGEPLIFTVSVKPTESKLTYKWIVSSGTIISGQGTETIRVNLNSSEASIPTATVEIGGLPQECPNSASETTRVLPPLQAEKVAQFTWPLDAKSRSLLKTVAKEAASDSISQLYIFVPPNAEIGRAVADEIYNATPENSVDRRRMTIVETSGKSSLIQIWLVPPGATRPSNCDACEKETPDPVCPSISVIGPQGTSRPGTTMRFAANVPNDYKGGYKWALDAGNIESGFGTGAVVVRVPADSNSLTITVSVELSGLPIGCPNTASGKGIVDNHGDLLEFDNYDRLTIVRERERLRNIAVELAALPGSMAVFLISVPKSSEAAFESRRTFVSNYLNSIKIDNDRVRFVLGNRNRYNTSVYIFPPGAEIPLPKR